MPGLLLYISIHHPFLIRSYPVFSVGRSREYFDHEAGVESVRKSASSFYMPLARYLLDASASKVSTASDSASRLKFPVSFSFSGAALEQINAYAPELLGMLKRLFALGSSSFAVQPYHQPAAEMYSEQELLEQSFRSIRLAEKLFGAGPKALECEASAFSAGSLKKLFRAGIGTFITGISSMACARRPRRMHLGESGESGESIILLEKSPELAANFSRALDIGTELSDEDCEDIHSTISSLDAGAAAVPIEFGACGHGSPSEGIMAAFRKLLAFLAGKEDGLLIGLNELHSSSIQHEKVLHHEHAGLNRLFRMGSQPESLNRLQESCMKKHVSLWDAVKASGIQELIEDWRRLSSSMHIASMAFGQKDKEAGLAPYDYFISYMNIMGDIMHRLEAMKSPAAPSSSAANMMIGELGRLLAGQKGSQPSHADYSQRA